MGKVDKVLTSFMMQLKRRYQILLKKDEIEAGLKKRRGECKGCGACCKSSIPCPFLIEKDGRNLCRIHESKPDVCRIYPFCKEDMFPHTREVCGYYFVDDEAEEKKTGSDAAPKSKTRKKQPAKKAGPKPEGTKTARRRGIKTGSPA